MLGVAGILAQEILKPGVFWYNAGLPENLPDLYFGGPDGKVGFSGTLPVLTLQPAGAQLQPSIKIESHITISWIKGYMTTGFFFVCVEIEIT